MGQIIALREYCVAEFGRALSPWRPDRRQALDDAIALGCASEDEHSRSIYLTVPAVIAVRPGKAATGDGR